MNEVLSNNVTKTKEKYVFIIIVSSITCIVYFGLWMLGVGYDMLVMVVTFINNSWEPTHFIVGVFEVQNIIVVAMTNQVIFLFNSFDLLNKIIVYVKSKGLNLNTLIKGLKSIVYVCCSPLQLLAPFVKLCLSHAKSKVVQYAIDDARVCQGFSKVSLKVT
jgi:hypothetical protein